MLPLLLLATWSHGVQGAAIAQPAQITPAPLVRRSVETLGYRSTGSSNGNILWAPVTVTLNNAIISTSANQYRLCTTGGPACNFFTCSGDYMVFASTSSYCGSSISSTCSYDVSYTGISDKQPLTNFWCDNQALTGWSVYATTPTKSSTVTSHSSSARPSSITASAVPADVTSLLTSVPTSTSSTIIITSPPSSNDHKSSNTGAIAGGVVGGLAGLAIIALAALFLLRRRKQQQQANEKASAIEQQQPEQPSYFDRPVSGSHGGLTPSYAGSSMYKAYSDTDSMPRTPGAAMEDAPLVPNHILSP